MAKREGILIVVATFVLIAVLLFYGNVHYLGLDVDSKRLTGMDIGILDTPVSGCQSLNIANTVYTLSSEISTSANCFVITENNITLDGTGKSINVTVGGIGVYVFGANETKIRNLIIRVRGATAYGIRATRVSNSTIENNTIVVDSGLRGISLDINAGGMNNIARNNISINGSNPIYGIDVYSSYNNFTDNLFEIAPRFAGNGLCAGVNLFSTSSGNLFRNNTFVISAQNCTAYRFAGSNTNNLFYNDSITISGSGSRGIYFISASTVGNFFIGLNITASASKAEGASVSFGNHNFTLIDSIINISSSDGYDLIVAIANISANLTNVSLSEKFYFNPVSISRLFRRWYLDISANYTNGLPAVGANIGVWNSTSVVFSDSTGMDGRMARTTFLESFWNSSGIVYFQYNVSAILGGVSKNISLDANSNSNLNFVFDVLDMVAPNVIINSPKNLVYSDSLISFNFSIDEPGNCLYSLDNGRNNNSMISNSSYTGFGAINSSIADGTYTVYAYCSDNLGNKNLSITTLFKKETGASLSVCRKLNLANTVYTLVNDVAGEEGCFNVTSNNVTLDCQGHLINYSTNGFGIAGIFVFGVNSPRVKNCKIVEGNVTGAGKHGVYFDNVVGGVVSNSNITTFNNSAGIYFSTTSWSNVSNNLINSSWAVSAVYFFMGSNNRIENTHVFNGLCDPSWVCRGVWLLSTSGSYLRNLSIESRRGLQIQSSSNNLAEDLRIRSDGSQGVGIYYSSFNNTLKNFSVYSIHQASGALYLQYSSHSFYLENGILNSPDGNDFYVEGNVNGGDWNFTNVTFSDRVINTGANGSLFVSNYLDVSVRYSNGSSVSGANVDVYDRNNVWRGSWATNSNGQIPRQPLLSYVDVNLSIGRTVVNYSNYTVNASISGLGVLGQSWSMDAGRNLIFSFTPPGAPEVAFVQPTTPDGGYAEKDVIINVSIGDSSVEEVMFSFNGTNYTIYNDYIFSMMNFENKSSLGENSTFVSDLSIYRNNGTVYGGANWGYYGKYGGAFKFDGLNDYMSIPTAVPGSNFSMSIWVNVSQTQAEYGAIAATSTSRGLFYRKTNSVFSVYDTSDCVTTGKNLGEWYNLILVKNDSAKTLYVNGIVEAICPVGAVWQIRYIGNDSMNEFFNGTVDEFRIFNRSLSAAEVRENYYLNLYKHNQSMWHLYVNQSNLSNGAYKFSIYVSNNAGKYSINERSVSVFGPFVSVNALYPTADAALNSGSIDYRFNVTSLYTILNCSMNIDSMVLSNTSYIFQGENVIPYSTVDGIHNYFFRCSDILGNFGQSSVVRFSTSTPASPGGNPASPGGGSPGNSPSGTYSRTYFFTEAQLEIGFWAALARNDKLKVNYNSKNYSFVLSSLKNTSAVLKMGNINITLDKTGRKIDFDSDGKDDAMAVFDRFFNNTAVLFFKRDVVSNNEESLVITEKNQSDTSFGEVDVSGDDVSGKKNKASAIYVIVIIILLVLILTVGSVLLSIYIMRKKKKSKEGNGNGTENK